ncbi:MAG: phosphatase PAP2 family protein [Thermomicrobiales bacterium]
MPQRSKRKNARGRNGVTFTVCALGVFALLFTLVRNNRTTELDHAVTVRLQRRKPPWFSRLMHLVSWPGFPPQSRIIPWTLPAIFLLLGRPVDAVFQLMGWGTGFLSFVVKHNVRRPRPNHPAINIVAARIGGTSFPSGHVINYVGVYGTLAFLIQTHVRPAALRAALVAALSSLIALVGPSRIYLGHHWLTDVSASYLLGLSYLTGLTAAYRFVRRRLVST